MIPIFSESRILSGGGDLLCLVTIPGHEEAKVELNVYWDVLFRLQKTFDNTDLPGVLSIGHTS